MRGRSISSWTIFSVFMTTFSKATAMIDQSPTSRHVMDRRIAAKGRFSEETNFVDFLIRNRLELSPRARFEETASYIGPLEMSDSRSADDEVSSGEVFSTNNHSRLLADATTVLCRRGFLMVLVEKARFEEIYGNITEEQLSFRDVDERTCRATPKASNRTHLGLATLNAHCSTSISTFKTTRNVDVQLVENQVIFRPNSLSADLETETGYSKPLENMIVNIECSTSTNLDDSQVPAILADSEPQRLPSATVSLLDGQDYTTSNHSFRLTLSDKQWAGVDAEAAWVKFPYQVAIGSTLYAQIQINQPSTDDDLKAFAKECFLSSVSDPRHSEPKVFLIMSGCPIPKKASLYHAKAWPMNRYTRMSFRLERIYFDSQYMFFHCKVVACSIRGGRERDGYETCPNSTVCSDRTIDSRYVPMESTYSYVSSGLLRPIFKDEPSQQANTTCPPCPTQVPAMHEPQQNIAKADDGVPMAGVIGIGVCSFVLGLILMGALWFVHAHTEPKKYLQAHGRRRNSDKDSSYASTTSPNVCTPMTKIITGNETHRNGCIISDRPVA